MRSRLCAALVVLLAASGVAGAVLSPPVVEAHTISRKGNFFWFLGSRDKGKDNILDPINIQWAEGGLYNHATEEDDVKELVEQNWGATTPGGPPPSKQKMLFGSLCLGQKDIIQRRTEKGVQDAIFKAQGGASNRRQETQYQGSTSSHCFTQWHMRFWTDHVHDDITPAHGEKDQWAISGVHHDIARCSSNYGVGRFGGCHEISKKWVAYRNYGLRRLRVLCSRSKWKRYPGGDRSFQGGKRYDGWVARVSLTYDGNCPRGLR